VLGDGHDRVCPAHSKALAVFAAVFAVKGIIQSSVMHAVFLASRTGILKISTARIF